jgi:hypothetical protein
MVTVSIPTEDVFLETVIAEALDAAPCDDHAATARRIIDAIAGRSNAWYVTDPTRTYLDVATMTGEWSASGSSCTHLFNYSGPRLAGIPGEGEPDYLHLCELDEHIALLVGLREARRRFEAGETLPVCGHECVTSSIKDGAVAQDQCQCCGKTFGEAVPTARVEPVPVLVPKLIDPVVLVPCPGAPCVSYLYGADHQHTARQP